MSSNFQDKVIWITGASSGIGEALAMECAKAGARLVLSARREEELIRVQKNASVPNDRCLVLPMDMEKIEEIPQKLEAVLQKFGSVHYLFHNAGISQRSFVKDTPLDVDRKVMNVNFMSAVALTKLVLPVFLKQGVGHFVVTSSLVGKFGTPMRSAYSASKHALHGFFEALRAETWKEGVQVTIVCPGYIKTNISMNAVDEKGTRYGKMDDNQANGMPAEECARRILRAVANGKREVLIGGKEILGVYLKRFFPALLWRVVRKLNVSGG